VGFGGNVWCQERRDILDRIARKWKLESFTGMPEVLSEMYARSRVGFNVSTFYGTDVAYDVNMRVFEVLACGIPLVTNHLPDLERLGIIPEFHCATYVNPDAAMSRIRLAIQRGEQYRQEMGERARQLILDAHTYVHRMDEALGVLEAAGVLVA
jgi:spore maturation protein CgeB